MYTKHSQLTCQIFSDVDNVGKIFFSPRNFLGVIESIFRKIALNVVFTKLSTFSRLWTAKPQ